MEEILAFRNTLTNDFVNATVEILRYEAVPVAVGKALQNVHHEDADEQLFDTQRDELTNGFVTYSRNHDNIFEESHEKLCYTMI